MTKKRKKQVGNFKKWFIGFWLLWSMAGGILFSFGLLAFLNGAGKLMPVLLGAGMIVFAILTGKFTTETALAWKLKR